MSELVARVLDGLAGLPPTALYLLAGLFTALETSVGIGLLVPGGGVVLMAGTTATTLHRFAALVAVTVLGPLAGESPPRRSWPAAGSGGGRGPLRRRGACAGAGAGRHPGHVVPAAGRLGALGGVAWPWLPPHSRSC